MSNDTINPEILEGARLLYINGMSLREIATQSETLLGQKVSLDRLKRESKKDAGLWSLAEEDSKPKTDIGAEVDTIRQIVYQSIVAGSQDGFWISIGNPDYQRDVEKLLRNMEAELMSYGAEVKRIKPRGVDANLVNSYMNLLAKSNVTLDIGASGKTSREQAMDLIDEALSE